MAAAAQIRFYDLELNVPEQFWSPNTCKTRFTLNIKNIPYETTWVDLVGIHKVIPGVTKSGKPPTVPVIEDLAHDGKPVQDSWDIAVYLEEAYPDSPSLFHGNKGLHKFFYDYATAHVLVPVFQLCCLHVLENCGSPEAQAGFRYIGISKFGVELEVLAGNPSEAIATLKKSLIPIHSVLKEEEEYPFITGDKVGFADVALAAYLTSLEVLKPELFKPAVLSAFNDDVLRNWWNRMEQYRTTTTTTTTITTTINPINNNSMPRV